MGSDFCATFGLDPGPDARGTWESVGRDGKRNSIELDHDTLVEYAKNALNSFEVAKDESFKFEKALAQADLSENDKKKGGKKGAAAAKK